VVPVPASAIPAHGFLEWVYANPVVIAALIAGGVAFTVGILTFTGVVISLRHSRMESRRDREHSADEANKERMATMRREVYLDAVRALVKVQMYVGGLAKQDITKTNIMLGFEDFQIAASKVAVVAEQATALKVRELSSRYAVLALNSIKILVPIAKARLAAQHFGQLYDASNDAAGGVLKEMDQLNKVGPQPEKFALLKSSFDMHSKFAGQHMADRDNANNLMVKGEFDYADSVRGEIRSIAIELDDLVCAIRQELNIATDREAFRSQTAKTQDKIMSAVDDVLKLAQTIDDKNPT
jgi:hypothetical protein